MLILVIIVLTLVIMTFVNLKRIKELEENAINAEERALIHFRKLYNMENILFKAEMDKTPAVIIVDKIKEVIVGKNK